MNWSSRKYRLDGERAGIQRELLDRLIVYGNAIDKKELPVIFTLGHLSKICEVHYGFLQKIISRNYDPYRRYAIHKHGGRSKRQISVPHPLLKRVQGFINREILSSTKAHQCATAYIKNSSPSKNAAAHCNAKWLIKLDVQNFFESISERQVYHVFRDMGYTAVLSFQMARLTTSNIHSVFADREGRWKNEDIDCSIAMYRSREVGYLPQGAPTSPMLANLVCKKMDEKFLTLAQEFSCEYTRYSDDIVFSAVKFDRIRARKLIVHCSQVLSEQGFKRNEQKTHIVPPGARKIVTGLVVNGAVPRLSREFKENIENHLYHAKVHTIAGHCLNRGFRSIPGFYSHLKGLITYAKHIDKKLGTKYENEFKSIDWPSFIK